MPESSDADALYSLLPEEFVAARTALAQRLRANGDRVAARAAANLRRPSVSAWALNQVARTAPALIADVLSAGDGLRAAMTNALAGDASGLRRSETDERVAVDAVLTRATAVVAPTGRLLADPYRQRMVATMRAAVLDEGIATLLRNGTLDADHEAPPFGFSAGPESAEIIAPATKSKHRQPDEVSVARERARQADIARLGREADRIARQAARLEEAAVDAERRARELRTKAREAADAAGAANEKLAMAQTPSSRRQVQPG